ncbi:unnamed protein product [Schistosoma bovis]|nr:unnamed protein product [Schistosoma bovis]
MLSTIVYKCIEFIHLLNPELLKLNQGNAGFNVESNEKNKRTKPRVKLSNSNINKKNTTVKKSFLLRLLTRQLNKNGTMNMDHAHVNTTSSTSVLPISCNLSINNSNPLSISSTSVLSSSTGQIMNPFRLNYSVDMMNSRLYNPNIHHSINYGPYSPICVNTTNNIPVISDDYQSLNCWNDLPVYYSNQLKQDNITNLNIPQLYMKQLKQPINAQNSNLDINNNNNNNSNNNNITSSSSSPTATTTTLSPLPIVLHNKQNDSNWILHNTHLLMNNNNNK